MTHSKHNANKLMRVPFAQSFLFDLELLTVGNALPAETASKDSNFET